MLVSFFVCVLLWNCRRKKGAPAVVERNLRCVPFRGTLRQQQQQCSVTVVGWRRLAIDAAVAAASATASAGSQCAVGQVALVQQWW